MAKRPEFGAEWGPRMGEAIDAHVPAWGRPSDESPTPRRRWPGCLRGVPQGAEPSPAQYTATQLDKVIAELRSSRLVRRRLACAERLPELFEFAGGDVRFRGASDGERLSSFGLSPVVFSCSYAGQREACLMQPAVARTIARPLA